MKILIATGNKGKLDQFKRIFDYLGSDIELLSLKDVGIFDDVSEDQETLLGNARKKAKFYAEKSGLPALSDDFGIFVDALGGFPGVHSKRWLEGSDEDRCHAIIEKLKDFSREEWTAKYIGAVVLYDPEKEEFWENEHILEGSVSGDFSDSGSFGYDPIFVPVGGDKCLADVSDAERDFMIHRGVGIKTLLEYLND
ncbi:non-canonical purine NTP pyrophosphatase [Patescibacteria group bacterium]